MCTDPKWYRQVYPERFKHHWDLYHLRSCFLIKVLSNRTSTRIIETKVSRIKVPGFLFNVLLWSTYSSCRVTILPPVVRTWLDAGQTRVLSGPKSLRGELAGVKLTINLGSPCKGGGYVWDGDLLPPAQSVESSSTAFIIGFTKSHQSNTLDPIKSIMNRGSTKIVTKPNTDMRIVSCKFTVIKF